MDGGTFFIIATYYNIHTSKRGIMKEKGWKCFAVVFFGVFEIE
jgi:hypothetical protein